MVCKVVQSSILNVVCTAIMCFRCRQLYSELLYVGGAVVVGMIEVVATVEAGAVALDAAPDVMAAPVATGKDNS